MLSDEAQDTQKLSLCAPTIRSVGDDPAREYNSAQSQAWSDIVSTEIAQALLA